MSPLPPCTLSLTFDSQELKDPLVLTWGVQDHSLARKWFEFLWWSLEKRDMLGEQRLCGFYAGDHQLREISDQLRWHCEKINHFFGPSYHIPGEDTQSSPLDQDQLNRLHHHFELLIGQSQRPAKYYEIATPEVRESIRKLNDLIHDFESLQRVANGHSECRYLQMAFVPNERISLSEQDYKQFSLKLNFGDLVGHYCELGKTWQEAYWDRDDHIFDNNINPLRHFTSGFMAIFYDAFQNSYECEKETHKIKEFMRSRGFDPTDPLNSVGQFCLAKPLGKWDEVENRAALIQQIAARPRVKKISLRKSEKTLFKEMPWEKEYFKVEHGIVDQFYWKIKKKWLEMQEQGE